MKLWRKDVNQMRPGGFVYKKVAKDSDGNSSFFILGNFCIIIQMKKESHSEQQTWNTAGIVSYHLVKGKITRWSSWLYSANLGLPAWGGARELSKGGAGNETGLTAAAEMEAHTANAVGPA